MRERDGVNARTGSLLIRVARHCIAAVGGRTVRSPQEGHDRTMLRTRSPLLPRLDEGRRAVDPDPDSGPRPRGSPRHRPRPRAGDPLVRSFGRDDERRRRALALGSMWFETPPVTIIYRTTDRPPGEPISAHQCLRQMSGFSTERQWLLATCNPSGTVALAWNPPKRWRMDMVTADDAFAVVATPSASFHCQVHPRSERCIRLSPNGAAAETAFAPLVTEPERILERIGVSEGGPVIRTGTRTIARSSATCFSATGRSQVNEVWCFSDEGLLLFASTSTPDGTRMTAEATRVSPGSQSLPSRRRGNLRSLAARSSASPGDSTQQRSTS